MIMEAGRRQQPLHCRGAACAAQRPVPANRRRQRRACASPAAWRRPWGRRRRLHWALAVALGGVGPRAGEWAPFGG